MDLVYITPTDIGNLMVNLPRHLYDFYAEHLMPGIIADACVRIKAGQMTRREFTQLMQEAYDQHCANQPAVETQP